jgi:short-subunit dehydrogenase
MTGRQLAVATRASNGIGLELARLSAADGNDLVVVADDPEIDGFAVELSAFGVSVVPLRADLGTPVEVERVYGVIDPGGRTPTVAALNAGIGRAGRFVDGELAADLDIIEIHVRSTVHLAKLVLRDMAETDAGRALFTSSFVAMVPDSYQTMYNASKSFIQSFGEGLRDEFRGTGVSIIALTQAQPTPSSPAALRCKTHRWVGCRSRTIPPRPPNRDTTPYAGRPKDHRVLLHQQADRRRGPRAAGLCEGVGQPTDRHTIGRPMSNEERA